MIIIQLLLILWDNYYFNKRLRSSQYIILSIIAIPIYLLTYNYIGFLTTGILWLYIIFISMVLSKQLFSALYHSTLSISLYILMDYLVVFSFGHFFINNLYVRFMFSIGFYVIGSFIINKTINRYLINSQLAISVAGVMASLTFLIYFIIIAVESFTFDSKQVEQANAIFIILYGLFAVLLSLGLFYVINKFYQTRNREHQMEYLIQYAQEVERNYNELRKFRHDYKNMLLSLDSYITEGNLEALREYFFENIKDTDTIFDQRTLNISQLSNLYSLDLKGVIVSKLLLAIEKSIDVTVEIPEKIKVNYSRPLVLVRMMGIILDNAVEAAEKSEKGYIRPE